MEYHMDDCLKANFCLVSRYSSPLIKLRAVILYRRAYSKPNIWLLSRNMVIFFSYFAFAQATSERRSMISREGSIPTMPMSAHHGLYFHPLTTHPKMLAQILFHALWESTFRIWHKQDIIHPYWSPGGAVHKWAINGFFGWLGFG